MKNLIIFALLFINNVVHSSSFEIKITPKFNDCVTCSNYLFSLNNVSNNYKVEVSDSLHQIFSAKSQNFVHEFNNNQYLSGIYSKATNANIDTLNNLSYEDGDTVKIGYRPDVQRKSKIVGNDLYLLNTTQNTLYITDLIKQSSDQFRPNPNLIAEIFNKTFKDATFKLFEIRAYYKSINEKHAIKINSFDVDTNNLYLFVDIPYIEKIERNYLDTFITHISCLLMYKNGEKKPKIFNLDSDFTAKEYDYSSHQLTIVDGEALINVFLKDKKYYTTNTFWLCKCKLKEEMEFIPENCIKRPEIHSKLNLGHHFSEYLLSGDYLINPITNELINHRTKSTTDLNLPIQKIIFDDNDRSKISIPFVLYDINILGNEAQIIYSLNYSYYYMKLNLLTNKQIENYVLFEDVRSINGPPKLFLNNMIYYFPKNAHYLILKNLKSKI